MSKTSKIIHNSWTVTLVSTMIGVILGLYITSYFEERNLLKAKENALEQVSIELSVNKELLKDYHEILTDKYEALSYIFEIINEDLELITHLDSLDSFKNKTQSIFTFSTFEPQTNDLIKIKGQLDVNIESDLIVRNLSHIVWDSYKQTNYMSVTNFKCLTDVEAIYVLQHNVNLLNTEWLDFFFKEDFIIDLNNRKEFMNLWQELIKKQSLLLSMNEFQSELMKECN